MQDWAHDLLLIGEVSKFRWIMSLTNQRIGALSQLNSHMHWHAISTLWSTQDSSPFPWENVDGESAYQSFLSQQISVNDRENATLTVASHAFAVKGYGCSEGAMVRFGELEQRSQDKKMIAETGGEGDFLNLDQHTAARVDLSELRGLTHTSSSEFLSVCDTGCKSRLH